MSLDFNRANLSEKPISQLVNELIEGTEPASVNYRLYLGASSIGSECLRKIQLDWMCDPVFPARVKDIFARGHFFEERTRQHLIDAGFKFAPAERLKFKAADELFRGHADGIVELGAGESCFQLRRIGGGLLGGETEAQSVDGRAVGDLGIHAQQRVAGERGERRKFQEWREGGENHRTHSGRFTVPSAATAMGPLWTTADIESGA